MRYGDLSDFAVLPLSCLAILLIMFVRYAGKHGSSLWDSDPRRTTPSHRKHERNFFPVRRWMLFGSHLQGIVTVGAIFLPSICLTFGWLPALTLLTVGVLFSGWVHDYASIILSVRSEGEDLPSLFGRLMGKRCGSAFWLLGVFCALSLSSLSALQCAIILEKYPSSLISTIAILLSGALFALLFYYRRFRFPVAMVSSLGVVLLGVGFSSIVPFKGLDKIVIISILYLIALLYAIAPSRYLSQSVGFVASIPTLIVIAYMLIISLLSSLITPPSVSAFIVPSSDPLTMLDSFWSAFLLSSACGIVSGWHGLIGSSVTARHVDLETDVDVIGVGSMFVESALALGSLLVYASMSSKTIFASSTPWEALIKGLSRQIEGIVGEGDLTLLLISLVATLLVVCCINSLRLAISLWKPNQNGVDKRGKRRLGIFFVLACLSMSWFLTYSSSLADLWSIFAGVNQLLASLVLMLAAIFLKRSGKRILGTIIPSILLAMNSLAFLTYLGAWRFLNALEFDDLFGSSVFSKSFSGAVDLVFLTALSLLSATIGIWLIFKTLNTLSLRTSDQNQGRSLPS